ncbi:MAG: hypothetical protein IJ027_03630 [Oscillospiraceae bacterium]|nr:hypothetical protein [Oscillospiraceae bacterium]
MIDFHSHILPQVDDGSSSIKESVELLKMLSQQGVTKVCATPHFIASKTAPEAFFEKRQAAFEALKPNLTADAPKIKLGAEVFYYNGISKMQDLSRFCIEGSRLLLLEMPFHAWSEYNLKEILELSCSGEFQLLLAHIERYPAFQNKKILERLIDSDILLQTNASAFLHFKTRNRALRLLKQNKIHFIGSDCHSVSARPPRMDEAREVVSNKLGESFVKFYDERAERFLEDLE